MLDHKAHFGKDEIYYAEMELLHAELLESAHDL
jgi:hypothetical protein